MAYETNDLKRILILVLFAIPMIASRNINCSGKAFHCVNSTHFMICVDLGGGVSITIDDFVIPCPATTVCHKNNIFECDFPEIEVTTPPLQVIDIYKQSDTSETTLVTTTSVTAPTAMSDIFSVFKENITATTLPIPEDVTPDFKLEVLEVIKNPTMGNSDNTTETNIQVNSSFIYTTNEVVNDKQPSNKTITTSATDNNKNLEPAVETSIHKAVNTSLTDKTKSIDTVTSVIGLIHLISTDHPTVVSTKPSSDVLTSLDNLYDNIATTTEQYSTKKVIIQGENVKNVPKTIQNQTIPTEITSGERSVIKDDVSTTPVINTFIEKDINNSTEYINKTDSDNQTVVKRNSLGKSNSTTELVPETTTEYLAPVKIDNISEPVTEVPSPQTTPVEVHTENVPSTKSASDYLNTLNDNIITTNNQNRTNQNTTLHDIPVTTEIISTSTILNTDIQNIKKADTKNDFFTEVNTTVGITTTEKVSETNTIYFTAEPVTVASLQTTTEKTLGPITEETNTINTTETTQTSGDLINNYSLVEKQTTVTQLLEIITTTDSSIQITDKLYQINRELNQTLLSTINNTADTMNATETFKTVYNASTKDIINDKSIDPILLLPTTINPAIEIGTTEAIQNEFTAQAKEATNELPEVKGSSSVNEPYKTNVKNYTLFYHTTNSTKNTTENVKLVLNALKTDIINNQGPEETLFPSTKIIYPAIVISSTETKQNEFTAHPIEVTSELPATNIDHIETNTLLRVQTTPISDAVTNTTVNDLTSQTNIVINAQIGFTPDIIELKASDDYTSIDQSTTQKVAIYPETKIPGSLNQQENLGSASLQENLNADQWTTTIADQDEVSMTTTYLNNIENSASTPLPGDGIENNSYSDINKVEITGAINKVNVQDILPKTNYYVTELSSTTPNTVQTTSLNMDTMKLPQVSTNTPELVNNYSVSTTDYKIETSTTFPVVLTNTTNIENVTIVPVFDIINSSVSAMPTGTMQLSSSYPSLTNDYVKTTQSQESSVYVPATDNIPDYNFVPVKESVNQKTSEAIVSLAETKVMNSVLATPSTHNLPIIINTENVEYVGTKAPLPSTIVLENIHPIKTAVNYVVDKTNDYSLSPESILTQINKVHKVEADSFSSSASTLTPDTTASSDGWVAPDNTKITTIIDSAFTMSSTQIPPKVIVDDDKIENTTEYSLSMSKEIETETAKYNTETSLPISRVSAEPIIMTTESTHTTKVFTQTTPLTVISETNQDVIPVIKTSELPRKILSMVNNNIPQSTTALHTAGSTAGKITAGPTPAPNTFAQTTPSLATIGGTNHDVIPEIQTTDLPHVLSIVNNNIPQSTIALHIADVTAAQISSGPTPTTDTVTQTTPSLATIGESNQNVLPEMKTTDLPQNVLSVVNNNITQSTPALHIAGATAAQITLEPISTTNTNAQTMLSLATIGKTNQDVMKTTDLQQNVLSKENNNIRQSTPALHIAEVTAAQITSQPIPTTNTFAETMSSLATIGKTNQDGTKMIDLPQNVLSAVNNNIPQSTSALLLAEVTTAQITSKPTLTTTTFVQTTPSLAAIDKMDHNILPEIKTTNLPQYGMPTVNNYNLVVSDFTTKTVSPSVSDFMTETIKIDGDKVSGTSFGDTISSDVMTSNPTVQSNYGVKSVKNGIDHESMVIANASKNNSQNTTITNSVDINKAEVVNHTETDWMRPDVNIDMVQIKKSSTEKPETLESSVIQSSIVPQNQNLPTDSSIISQIKPIDVKTVDIIDSKIATVTSSPPHDSEKQSNAPNTQSKTVTIKENTKMVNYSSVNKNIDSFDVQADSKNVTHSYNLSNTTANTTTSYYNLSRQNSTINDELEQHLLSTNHTITAEIQSHLNESAKQSNKTGYELTFNVTQKQNPNLATPNATSENKSAIAVTPSVFNCSNHTRGKYADNKDCRKFYTCIGNLQPMLGTCPNNTVFSEINKQCTKNLSHCIRNNQFHCLFEGRFGDFFKDNIYYICVKNKIHGFIRYKLQCQNNYHLNKESVKCEKNEELSTQSVSSVSETNDESKSEPKSEKLIITDNFECENEGKFPHTEDCSKYYVCTKIKNVYRRKIKKCASDEVFDKKKKKCVESHSGEC